MGGIIMGNSKKFKIVSQILDACRNMAEDISKNLVNDIENIECHAEYAEPGYSSNGPILLANWNMPRLYDINGNSEALEKAKGLWDRMKKALEKAGAQLEWFDEWTSCHDCGALVRTQPDCYSWQASFAIIGECDLLCHKCVEGDPSAYLEGLEGNANKACKLDIDLDAHGYTRVNADPFESGYHPGQTDNPRAIAKQLESMGVKRFLFSIDEVSQFYSRFSVYVHEDELEDRCIEGIQACLDLLAAA
jgi:hypothetical protein